MINYFHKKTTVTFDDYNLIIIVCVSVTCMEMPQQKLLLRAKSVDLVFYYLFQVITIDELLNMMSVFIEIGEGKGHKVILDLLILQ